MKAYRKPILAVVIAVAVASGCAPDITETDFFSRHPDPSEAPKDEAPRVLGQTAVDGWEIALLSRGDVFAGYNRLYVRLRAAGDDVPVTRVPVQLVPTREVDGVVITTPVDPPIEADADEAGLIPARALFLQDDAEPETWQVTVRATLGGGVREARFDVPVVDSLWLQVVDRAGVSPYYVAWIQPEQPRTGEDTIAFGLYEPTSDGFRVIEDAAIDLYPFMDMGGGDGHSTPYAAPAHTGDGRYEGRINFIMSGGWDMTVYVQRPGDTRDTVLFQRFIVE